MQTHTVSCQKGGTGKTTSAINIAGALADHGHRVLAVDADPQGYLTNTLGLRDAYTKDEPNLYTLAKSPREHDVVGLIESCGEYDVLPSNVDAFRLEKDLIASGRKPLTRFQTLIERIEGMETYDHVVIDAPPSMGPLNDNAILAADGLIIPVEPAEASVLALDHLLNQFESLERDYDTTIGVSAVILSNAAYPLNGEQRDAREWLQDQFENRCPVFEIRNRVAIQRSLNQGGSVFGPEAEECDMADVYREIAQSLGGGSGD